ncbi:hypothetical protein [Thalassolituus hydrocarboniclasticus]|uniref:Polysaccharide chain length determinant N-terminal domain-containing protein n=1 Tax=Thalassolituus hydrocarboniclasticus TaxID=2742796 RepID=A0ABY6ABH8_9GAMM|nr:hypothetical protein [Thalassolituus hydrocarboniclasticus]UXD87933.1 hypothetical protein HUF19_11050 [Thalassolituus hydrocarboniclasticus]
MSQQHPVNPAAVSPVIGMEDEVNLTDLFRNIWRQRGLVLGVALCVGLAVLMFHFARASFAVPHSVDYPITLTFLNGDKYPNGRVFSPRDIITPAVLNAVETQGRVTVSAEQLAKSLDVYYSNSLYRATEEKLNELLVNSKTPPEMRAAAESALKELREKSHASLTLSLNLQTAGITAAEAEQAVAAVVDAWAQLATERGLMNADIERPLQAFSAADNLNIIDVYDSATSYLESLQLAVAKLSEFPGTGSLVVDGRTLDDIRRQLLMLEGSEIGPLREFAYSNSSELAAKDPAIMVRLFSRQRLLRLEHERLTKLVASYDAALNQLSRTSAQDLNKTAGSNESSGAQFDESFLDSLLALGNKLGDVEMRKDLFQRRTAATEELLGLEKEIAILTGTDNKNYGNLDSQAILRGSLAGVETSLNTIQQQLDRFIAIYRQQTLQSGGHLFVADAAPVVRGGSAQVGRKIGTHLTLGIILGGMLGVMLALMRAAMISSRNKNRS